MRIHIIILFSLVTLLSGCATTTHFLTVTPTMELPTAKLSNTNKITVTTNSFVDDKVGKIETALKKRAELILANDIEERVTKKVTAGLESLGFTPENGNEPAAKLHIDITKFSYTTKTKTLTTVATINFAMKVTLEAKGKVYKSNYASEVIDEYTSLPKRASIEQKFSELTGKVINRLLNDPNIRILLKK